MIEGAKTIYVSGPMTGHPDLNRGMFDLAAETLRRQGHTVITPFDKELDGLEYADALLADLHVIQNRAEILVLLPGWDKSLGAMVEATFANALKIEVWEMTADMVPLP